MGLSLFSRKSYQRWREKKQRVLKNDFGEQTQFFDPLKTCESGWEREEEIQESESGKRKNKENQERNRIKREMKEL